MSEPTNFTSWNALLDFLIKDPHEKQRIAQEIRVKPITLHRWVANESRPREDNMRTLLKAIPRAYAQEFVRLIEQDFPQLVEQGQAKVQRIPSVPPAEFYAKALNHHANTPRSIYPQQYIDLVLQQALSLLDPEHEGISLSIISCVPPREGQKVRSLREISSLCSKQQRNPSGPKTLFLGSESLAGTAVLHYRPAVRSRRDEPASPTPAHWTDQEESAVAYPLLRHSKVAGSLVASSPYPEYFQDSHIRLIENYANLVALAFQDHEFYALEDIHLHLMPQQSQQEPYFRYVNQRVSQKMAQAASERRLLSLHEAQQEVWQELEEEFIQLAAGVTEKE
ncbi:GAF domain-containing protein [Thermosporothrix hazakensis]|uniref:GAF domain-containing protein n=2 Tax=Thermosporothrix TaxID=768650 RepID=A0A326UBL0_THEHA|nr:GAF domain-containing protein [Thermosporothrix hazakensis]PZW35992.1 GAF domain-containing protein [Thermosporothrix hazakensis]BBH88460.1 hypothetical protein KTC_32110 [Thermosporothrix sp. COM3]GCE46646.1 hypothetical protein KTH_15150 [Thermosporothrix hazakensis]